MAPSKIKLTTKEIYKSKVPDTPKINVTAILDCIKRAIFEFLFTTKMKDVDGDESVEETWKILSSTIHDCAIKSFESQKISNKDWVYLQSCTLIPLIEAKRAENIEFKSAPCQSTLVKTP